MTEPRRQRLFPSKTTSSIRLPRRSLRLRPAPPLPLRIRAWRRFGAILPQAATAATAFAAIAALVFTGLSLRATQEGQYTDRYTKAVDQLGQQGPEKLQIRLGGIYALERLARDSPRDQPTIVAVLVTFIHTTAPRDTDKGVPTLASEPIADTPLSVWQGSTCADQPITPDVQAALTVLGRRDPDDDQTARVDLGSACLGGADLDGANLSGAYLYNTTLYGASLNGANLKGANLAESFLSRADLRGADLSDADLSGANLNEAQVKGTNVRGANLTGANRTGLRLA